MSPASSSATVHGQRFATVLVVCAAFLMAHPYTGIRHDGTLYMGDALARLLPGQFHDDLYFLFGSQGRFTLLPALYAALISAFGAGAGTIVGMLGSFALYLAAAFYLVAAFAPGRWRALCVLSVALGWAIYGGNRIFAYSEPFLTARSFAEPLVLFGIGVLLRGRVVAAFVILFAALVVHPLIAAGGLIVAWFFLATRDWRWLLAAIPAGIALVALASLEVGPFTDVFARYDPEWLALVQEANGHAFVSRWSMVDYGIVAYNCVVLLFAARHLLDGPWTRLSTALIAAGLGATLFSLVAVDLFENPFFGKLQVWRAEWVMQWFAMAVLPLVLRCLWADGRHARVAACLLTIGWMASFSIAPLPLAVMALVIDRRRDRFDLSTVTERIAVFATIAIAVVIVAQAELRVVKFGVLLEQPIHLIVGQALTVNVLLVSAATALIYHIPRRARLSVPIAVSVLVVALFFWDQRGDWTRKLESYPLGTHIWPGLIEPDAKVYWYRDLIAPWLLLGHGNYYTQQQGSGAVFSRDMVVELDKRRKVTAILDFQEQICRMMNNLSEKQGSCEPDAVAVRTVCEEGGIDYVVLQSGLDGARPIAELSTGVVENGYEKKFFLFRCAALTKG